MSRYRSSIAYRQAHLIKSLPELSIIELVELVPRRTRLVPEITEEMFRRHRRNLAYLGSPWTQEAVGALRPMMADLSAVVADHRNASWARRHAGLKALIAVGVMATVVKREELKEFHRAGWISTEQLELCLRRNRQRKKEATQALRRSLRLS
ncbi:MAG: hypothetical protein Q8P33_03040 [bacterium]|nr:hypothetical protein [bacterium]